jgi:hypothetical protein
MPTPRKATATAVDTEEQAPWEVPPVEGDASISAGREVARKGYEDAQDVDDIMQSLMDWCVAYAEEHAADNAAVMAAEVRRILSGEDAESVLAETAPLNGKEHLEKPFMLRGFTLNPTDFSEGWPFYASMDCFIPGTGDTFSLNCGGPKVIAALRRLHELGEYPYALKVRGKSTRQGHTVLSLVEAGAPSL